jgi:hypothetical protein
VNSTFNPAVGLTFDVRGGPLAGRPLDGGVRHIGQGTEMPGTQCRHRDVFQAR